MSIEARLAELGISLPAAAAPAANYVPFVVAGPMVFISGQLPMENGKIACIGKVGADVDWETAKAAARLCGINLIAQMKAATGDLAKVKRIVRLGGFVNCLDSFFDQPKVINGASDLMVDVFGDAGRHARTAVGTNVLPFNAAVEIDAIVELA
jgi:enamine deaminase RidA (YjgF/YER057c/UK114 family)